MKDRTYYENYISELQNEIDETRKIKGLTERFKKTVINRNLKLIHFAQEQIELNYRLGI